MAGPALAEPSVGIYRKEKNFSSGTPGRFSYQYVLGTRGALERFDKAVAPNLELTPVSKHPASEFSPASGRCLRDFFSVTERELKRQAGVYFFGKIGADIIADGNRRIGFVSEYFPKGSFSEPNLRIISRHSGLGSELERHFWRDLIKWKKITHITTCVGVKNILQGRPNLVNDSTRHFLLLDPENVERSGQLEKKGVDLKDVLVAEDFCKKISVPRST